MLNRTSFSQNITTGLQPTPAAPLTGIRWQPVLESLQLPTTLRGFLAFLVGLLVLAGAMSIHVTLSADMMRLQLRLDELEQREARMERQNANLLWQISRHTDVQAVYGEAIALGYKPVEDRIYVVEPPAPALSPVNPSPDQRPAEDPLAAQQGLAPGRIEEWRAWLGGLLDGQ